MRLSTAQDAVRDLQDSLAGWRQEGGPFSPALLARLDADEAFPAAACQALDDAGLAASYVPAGHGGRLTDFPKVVAMIRAVARHDLTVAVAHGKTFLGAVSVWVAGPSDLADRLGRQIADGAVVCWGLTERGHGSDVLAGELTGVRVPGGWRLDGEKWLINNATRGRFACVLARTSPEGGARGFTLFLVDKRQLPAGSFRCPGKIRTLGIRGADISGLSLDGAVVPDSAMVGEEGKGAETVLKALQLTRTACAALSLGALDHAIDLARQFVVDRSLYGRSLVAMPLVRDGLGRIAARLFLAEAVTIVTTRAVHVAPQEMSVLSAVCKAFVPTVASQALAEVGELLGARGYLTDTFAHGAFAKLERDHRIVEIFDGTTPVNRQMLIGQFPRLGRTYGETDHMAAQRLTALVAGAMPGLAPSSLRLTPPSGCELTLAVPGLLFSLRRRHPHDASLHALLDSVESACADVHAAMSAHRAAPGTPGPAAFRLAERYEWCVAAAACLLLLSHVRSERTVLGLRAGLQLAVEHLAGRPGDDDTFAAVAEQVLGGSVTLFTRHQETSPW